MFLGSYERAVDEKQRIAIPKAHRDKLGGLVYLAPGVDGCIAVYPPETFERLATRIQQCSPNDVEVRAYVRLLSARTQPAELDAQGRIRLPTELAAAAGIARATLLIGRMDHLELWAPGRWAAYEATQSAQFDKIAAAALSANLSGGGPSLGHGPSPSHGKT